MNCYYFNYVVSIIFILFRTKATDQQNACLNFTKDKRSGENPLF